MKKVFLSLLSLLLIFSSSASADIVYTTVEGNMGRIAYSDLDGEYETTTNLYSAGESSIVSSYRTGGSAKVILITPNPELYPEGDKFEIFSVANLSTPENEESLFFNGILGTTSIVTATNADVASIFLTSEQGVVAEYRAGDYEPRNYYVYPSSEDVTAVKAVIASDRLYVLFNKYSESEQRYVNEILRFDGLLKKNSSFSSFDIEIEEINDFTVSSARNLFVAHDNGVVKFSSKTPEEIFSDEMKVTGVYSNARDSFYFVYEDENDNEILAYYDGTIAYKLYEGSNGTAAPKFVYDATNKVLAVIFSDGILLVDNSGTEKVAVHFIDSNELGGTPFSAAFLGVSTTTSNSSSSSSSSGCNSITLSLFGMLILCGLPLISKIRK